MVAACTLTSLISWWQCAETVYFSEFFVIAIFFLFSLWLSSWPFRDRTVVAMFMATFVAAALYGLGLINGVFVGGGILLTAVIAAYFYMQNSN